MAWRAIIFAASTHYKLTTVFLGPARIDELIRPTIKRGELAGVKNDRACRAALSARRAMAFDAEAGGRWYQARSSERGIDTTPEN